MSRAVFSVKTKSDLRRMTRAELDQYIAVLRMRTGFLRGSARKSTEKLLAVAMKLRAAEAES